jgi:hypothetical protein
MEVTIAGFADLANVDAVGKLNFIGHFWEIGAPDFPFVMMSMAFVLALRGGSDWHGRSYEVSVRMVDMDGQPMPFQLNETFTNPVPPEPYLPVLNHMVFNLRDMMFSRPGLYGVYVLIDGHPMRFEPLNVVQRSSPFPPGFPAPSA